MNRFKHLVLITLFSSAAITTASAQYQLPNPGFEGEWNKVSQKVSFSTVTGYEPSGWHSFVTAKVSSFIYNSAISNKIEESTDVRPGSSGSKSAKIWSNNILGVIANGNLTTGQIYGGSMTADDASGNYNFSDPTNTGYNQTFTGKPDSIVQWVKFVPVTAGDQARISAVIHENSRYQDPEATTYTNVVAKAQMNYDHTADFGWQRIAVPFVYEGNDKTPAYVLITYTTNKTPGKGSSGDVVYIDDIEMIYNSELVSATFDDLEFNTIEGRNDYVISLDKGLQYPQFTSAKTNGVSATYETEWTSDNVAVITVKGGDISENPDNKHVYTFTFYKTYTASVASNNPEMGSVYIMSSGTTSINISEGETTTIKATPNQHYEFVEWRDSNGEYFSSDASCRITISGDVTYTAVFREITHTVSVSCDETMGNVYVGDNTGSTSAQIGDGKSVTITAEAKDGYIFEGWMDSSSRLVSSNAEYTVANVTEDLAFTAVFAQKINSDLRFEETAISIYSDEGTFTQTASATDSQGEITYEISDSSGDNVATIDARTGTVTILGTGWLEITATQAEWGKYLETTAKYSLTIAQRPSGVEDASAAAGINVYGISGGIMVTGVEGSANVRVYSLNSVLVREETVSGNAQISVPYKGIYLIEVTSENGRRIFRAAVK